VAALVSLVVLYCWRWRKLAADAAQFGWALSWVASVTLAIIPKLAAYNQPLLIPALLVLPVHRESIKGGLLPRTLTKGAFACLLWQWATAIILSLSSFLMGTSRLQAVAEVPEYTLHALPLLTLLAVIATTFFLADASSRIAPAALSISQPLAEHEFL
jgi:hypothetical protein